MMNRIVRRAGYSILVLSCLGRVCAAQVRCLQSGRVGVEDVAVASKGSVENAAGVGSLRAQVGADTLTVWLVPVNRGYYRRFAVLSTTRCLIEPRSLAPNITVTEDVMARWNLLVDSARGLRVDSVAAVRLASLVSSFFRATLVATQTSLLEIEGPAGYVESAAANAHYRSGQWSALVTLPDRIIGADFDTSGHLHSLTSRSRR